MFFKALSNQFTFILTTHIPYVIIHILPQFPLLEGPHQNTKFTYIPIQTYHRSSFHRHNPFLQTGPPLSFKICSKFIHGTIVHLPFQTLLFHSKSSTPISSILNTTAITILQPTNLDKINNIFSNELPYTNKTIT
jgi:hypothetical protein